MLRCARSGGSRLCDFRRRETPLFRPLRRRVNGLVAESCISAFSRVTFTCFAKQRIRCLCHVVFVGSSFEWRAGSIACTSGGGQCGRTDTTNAFYGRRERFARFLSTFSVIGVTTVANVTRSTVSIRVVPHHGSMVSAHGFYLFLSIRRRLWRTRELGYWSQGIGVIGEIFR